MADNLHFDINPDGDDVTINFADDASVLEGLLGEFGLTVEEAFSMDTESPLAIVDDEPDEAGDAWSLSIDEGGGGELLQVSTEQQTIDVTTSIDTVQAMVPFAQCTSDLLTVLTPKALSEEDISMKYAISRGEFGYMPDDVFRVFHRILIDLSVQPKYQQYSPEDCLRVSKELLSANAKWTPRLNDDVYSASFLRWHQSFRKLAGTTGKVDDSDLAAVVDLTELRVAHEVFTLNSRLFNMVTNYLNDPDMTNGDEASDPKAYGELCLSYVRDMNLTRLTLADVRNLILRYFGSPELADALRMSTGDLLIYSVGELLRRYMLFELNAGIFYPVSIQRAEADKHVAALITALDKCMTDGSVAAEILYMILLLFYQSPKRAMPHLLDEFSEDLFNYLNTFLDEPRIVNPLFYGNVTSKDGVFFLDYADGEMMGTVESPDVLCKIVGTKHNTYVYPRVAVDEKSGRVICPSPELLTSLRSVNKGGRMKIYGGMRFEFSPTVGWLVQNKILAIDTNTKNDVKDTGISGEANSLLQMMLEYNNSFSAEEQEVSPSILQQNEYSRVIYGVDNVSGSEGLLIAAMTTASNPPAPIASGGLMVYIENTAALQYTTVAGDIEDTSFPADGLENVAASVESDGSKMEHINIDTILQADFSDIKEVPYEEYQRAVRQLCEMATLDYDEETLYVQGILARDLFYLIGVPRLDGVLASRVLQLFQQFAQNNNGVDRFNFPTLQELADIVLGKPNILDASKEYDEAAKKFLLEDAPKALISVKDVCAELDNTNLDVLALQVLSVNQISRAADTEMYLAYRQLPGVHSRLKLLENKMVVLRVFSLLREQGLTVFSKFTPLVKVYNEEVTEQTIKEVHYTLKEKMHRKLDIGKSFSLPLVRRIVEEPLNPDTSMFKYFALERDAYSLVLEMQRHGEKYSGLASHLLETVGLPGNTKLAKVSVNEFKKHVKREDVERMFSQNKDELLALLECGFISEITSLGMFQVTRAYDLFNTFYKVLVGNGVESDGNVSTETTLVDYAASFIVSYAPTIGAAANAIDGGEDRSSVFATNTDDFYCGVDGELLKQYNLTDMRLIVGSGE